jgi:hypothetical protein
LGGLMYGLKPYPSRRVLTQGLEAARMTMFRRG